MNLPSIVFMGKFFDEILTFLFDDLLRIFFIVMPKIGVDASTFWMIVLGIVAVWVAVWVVQQFLD